MPENPENRPLEAEDGDSNVSYRPAEPRPAAPKLRAQGAAPADSKAKERPAGPDESRRAPDLQTERYGPTSGKL